MSEPPAKRFGNRLFVFTLNVRESPHRKRVCEMAKEKEKELSEEVKSIIREQVATTVQEVRLGDLVRAVQPINRSMIPDLRKWLAPIRGLLFPGLRDKRTRKMIKLDLEAAGLPFKTVVGSRCFHALRNTYISQLFDAGLTINQVQRCARHTDIRLTTKYDKPRADEASLVDGLNFPGLT